MPLIAQNTLAMLLLITYLLMLTRLFLPNRVTISSTSLIDHIFCNFEHVISSGVLNDTISDHYPVFISLRLPIVTTKELHFRTFRPISNKGVKLLRVNLAKQIWSFIEETSNVDCDYDNLLSCVTEHLNMFLPTKCVVQTTSNPKPWITTGIKNSCKRKTNYLN
jgi:hypothetical protein